MTPPRSEGFVRMPDAEFQIRVAVPNGYAVPGIPVTEAVEYVHPGKVEA